MIPRTEFKETEIGPLPPDWAVQSIAESCHKPEYGYTASATQEAVGPRFLRITDIREHGVNWQAVPYCRYEGNGSKHQLRPGDILFARIGATTGKTFLVRDCPDAVYASYLIRVRPETVDPAFLYYFCNSELYWRQINVHKSDKLKGGISGSLLAQIRHCSPPFPEQRAIAGVLAKIQAAVEIQEKIVATLKELKAATMAKLFREGLCGEPLKQTEIGEIPESWELVQLGEVARIERGKFAHRPRNDPRFYGGSTPFIQTGDVAKCNGWIRTYTQTLNEEGLAISRVFPKGTIVLTIAANIADTGILEFDSAFPDSLVGVTPDATMDSVFLRYYLQTQKAEMDRLAPKGTQKNINLHFLRPWPVPRPSMEEQQAIAGSLRRLDEVAEAASARLSTLRSLFSSVLHPLMTGRVRVTRKMIALQALEDRRKRRPKWSGKVDEKILGEVVKRIVEAVAPEKIILFGSAARGEMGPDSDLDLLVVKACENTREAARTIRRQLTGIGVPKDVVVVTPEDVEEYKDIPGYIIDPALKEGKVLYAA